jgi:hypothetical protein
MNYTTTWNDIPTTNSNDSQWTYPHEEQFPTSVIPNDFPLYDPFNSGTGLTILSSALSNDRLEGNEIFFLVPHFLFFYNLKNISVVY